MKETKINLELETTLFVNVDDEPFTIYTNNQHVREFQPGEEHQVIAYIAQVGAKHLADRILQKKGVKDSNRDTPERQSLFARILPEWAKKIDVKPLSPEEEKKRVDERIAKQEEELAALKQEMKVGSDKDKEVEDLKRQVAKLTALLEKPKKVEKK